MLLAVVAAIRLLKPLKLVTILLIPSLATITASKPEDMVWVVVTAVLCTLIAVSIFVNSYVNFESRFVQWFSEKTASPRWFTVWVLIMALWIPVRHLLIAHGQLSNDTDFVVATLLWSCVPFMVENALKAASNKAMSAITELILEVKQAQDRSDKKDDLTLTILDKLLQAISGDGEGVNAQ